MQGGLDVASGEKVGRGMVAEATSESLWADLTVGEIGASRDLVPDATRSEQLAKDSAQLADHGRVLHELMLAPNEPLPRRDPAGLSRNVGPQEIRGYGVSAGP